MKRKNLTLTGIVTVSIIILFFGTIWMKKYFAIDKCLDKGGKWNYELNSCEERIDISEIPFEKLSWKTKYDTVENYEYLTKGVLMDSISLTPEDLIMVLNKRKPKCKLELIKLSGDTVFVQVINDYYLTERMGTTGAYCYLGETVYTLTEHNLINKVKLDLEFGSHASPGVYTRIDFKELIKNKSTR